VSKGALIASGPRMLEGQFDTTIANILFVV
jgi:hypothetical protein